MSMQNSTYDHVSSRSDEQSLIDQIAAALCPPVVERNESAPVICPEIGQILMQLSEAVAEASETERERTMRVALELEKSALHTQNTSALESESSLSLGSCVYYDSSMESATTLTTPSLNEWSIESSLSLSDCLSMFTALPHSELVYMSYYESGIQELDWSSVSAIYKPSDFGSLMFVVFNSFEAFVPNGLIPYTLEGLQSLLSSNIHTPIVSAVSPVSESVDEPPRMNLLEALNVQSDEDCTRIVTVRKCHKLGFKSHVHLRQYFSRFGRVDRVVLLPMRAKPKNVMDGRGNRPSSMGFVVMETKEAADRILSFNSEAGIHEIKGWPIEVRNFVKPADKPIDRDISGASTEIASEYAWY